LTRICEACYDHCHTQAMVVHRSFHPATEEKGGALLHCLALFVS
jgi:formate hydrogenlyase subunit 6/NADH:ubiquinone oxidoreductase subunit I